MYTDKIVYFFRIFLLCLFETEHLELARTDVLTLGRVKPEVLQQNKWSAAYTNFDRSLRKTLVHRPFAVKYNCDSLKKKIYKGSYINWNFKKDKQIFINMYQYWGSWYKSSSPPRYLIWSELNNFFFNFHSYLKGNTLS